MTISPCLIRFVPESARNHAGTDETVPMLLAARVWTHTGHQMSQVRKKHMARPGLEPRTSRRPCEHYRAIWSTCDRYRGHCETSEGFRLSWLLGKEMGHEIPTSQMQYHADYKETDQKRSMLPMIQRELSMIT